MPGLAARITHDEKSGGQELRFPLPDAETAQKLGDVLASLGNMLKPMAERR